MIDMDIEAATEFSDQIEKGLDALKATYKGLQYATTNYGDYIKITTNVPTGSASKHFNNVAEKLEINVIDDGISSQAEIYGDKTCYSPMAINGNKALSENPEEVVAC